MRHRKPPRRGGFTLVEVLIVVVILGILAAAVLPQFSASTQEASTSVANRNVQSILSQIQLYRFQHNGDLPDTGSHPDLVTALTTKTKVDGSAGGDIGPYLIGEFPRNPFDPNDATAATVTKADEPDGNGGWYYDPNTGAFGRNDEEMKPAAP